MRASTFSRKFIAAVAVGPHTAGSGKALNFNKPMFGGSRSAFSKKQLLRSIWVRMRASASGFGPVSPFGNTLAEQFTRRCLSWLTSCR